MVDFLATQDLNSFLIKVFKATSAGLIPWEKTADAAILTAPIEGEYNLIIQEVSSFENTEEEESDYTLSLLKGRQNVFVIDYRNFPNLDFSNALGTKYKNTWTVFKDLWVNSYLKAHKISDELKAINAILDIKLSKDPKK